MARGHDSAQNRLLATLRPGDHRLLSDSLETIQLASGSTLFEPGEDITTVNFPAEGTITALMLCLKGGTGAEAALIGKEGAIGGVISEGDKPAFTRGVVQMGGPAFRLSVDTLNQAKAKSPTLRNHFASYADCLLAQVLQSVACNAIHDLDARLARWLLTLHDRVGSDEMRVTQEFIAEMLGVQRPYVTRVIGQLEKSGAIVKGRGIIIIVNRKKLERQACECYAYLRRHFERVLPGVYPQ